MCVDLEARTWLYIIQPSWIPVVGVGQLGGFWQVMEAVDARAGLAHGLAVKAAPIKVGELLPVVLFILVEVVVVGVHHVIQGFSVGLLGLWSPVEKEQSRKIYQNMRVENIATLNLC